MISFPVAVLDSGALAAWCGLVRCGQEIHLASAAVPRAVVADVLALIADRHEGDPAGAAVEIFDLQRAPVTWFDDLSLAVDGLRWVAALDCTIATGLCIALARRENLPLLSFDGRPGDVDDLTVVRLPRAR